MKNYLFPLILCFLLNIQEKASAIVGGVLDTSHLSVVKIRGMSLCGGTAISPYIIITAAHCTNNGSIPLTIHSEELNKDYEVKKVIPHPTAKFNQNQGHLESGHDISIIILNKPIILQNEKFPMIARRGQFKAKDGSELILIGAGVDESGWPSGKKKSVKAKIQKIPYFKCGGNEKYTFSTEHKARMGDSGGPAIMLDSDGNEILTGITSKEIIFDYENEYLPKEEWKDMKCKNKSIFINIVPFLSWIKQETGYYPGVDHVDLEKHLVSRFGLQYYEEKPCRRVVHSPVKELGPFIDQVNQVVSKD